MDKSIQISLTEFMDYVNSSGSSKTTVVAQAKKRREEGHNRQTDYWMQFRNAVRSIHSSNGRKNELSEIVERIHEDKIPNYNAAIKGYMRFWGKKKISWSNPPRKVVSVGGTRVSINPELSLSFNGKKYFIKMFLHVDEILDSRHADLILALMHEKLSDRLSDDTEVAVLDVMRGKLYPYKNTDVRILHLLEAEGYSFNILWEAL